MKTYNATFVNAVRSELLKLMSLRSVWITSIVAIGFYALFSFFAAMGVREMVRWTIDAGDRGALDGEPLTAGVVTMVSTLMVMFTIASSTTAVTNEYSHKTIHTSLVTTNSRQKFFAAKVTAFSMYWFVVSLVALIVSMLIAYMVLSQVGAGFYDLGNGDTILTILYFFLLIWAILLMGMGVGMLCRSTAGSITLMFGILFILQIITAIPVEFIRDLSPYLPFALMGTATVPKDMGVFKDALGMATGADLTQEQALLGLFLYAFVFLGLGAFRLHKSDA